MSCKMCGSTNQREFPSEINIHPPRDWKQSVGPFVWAFPLLSVCSDCGFTEFSLSDGELKNVREHYSGIAILAGANLAHECELLVSGKAQPLP